MPQPTPRHGFFMTEALPMVQGTVTMKLHALLDWDAIAKKLKGLYQREISNAGGPEPYAPLSMFKLILLGQWHQLSDEQLEHAAKMRVDFMAFTGFEPGLPFPDASTICRFRNRLVQAQLDQPLLRLINKQLQLSGLMVNHARGAIVDATIIPSAARPNAHLEITEEDQPQVVSSADVEARWVKKGKKSYYGYRGYAVVETEDGYVEHVEVHPANESEINKLQTIVDKLEPEHIGVLADKGFASKANRDYLKKKKKADFIQHKASRGHALSKLQKQMNGLIAKYRYKVEQGFGTMKRRLHLARARYMGIAKVQAQMCWAALGLNLIKAHRKLQNARA